MLRNDGDYRFYIIKHKYKKKGEWADSGDCWHWVVRQDMNIDIRIDLHEKHVKDLTPFSSSGRCWQETGVHGAYHKMDALKILNIITDLNPEHTFAIFVVNIKQTTDFITQMVCEI